MKSDLASHLDKTRDTVTGVDRIVSSHRYPGDTRTVMIRGLLATIIQHHRSILQLLKSGAVDSSYALARDIVKGTRYGLWINSSATEEDISRIEADDEFPLSIPELVRAIDAAYDTDPFFQSLKNRWGSQLYKYTRSDVVQLGRWNMDASSGLRANDKELGEVTTIATLCILLLAAKFLSAQKHLADCQQIEALAADYARPRS
jgi:hypothetical protein